MEIAEKPSFSGRFGRFLISRQLKIRKKREAWFLFAGKPVRFSIREFALVTGLNCRNFPPHTKKRTKKTFTDKPYWGELFGTMKDVPVSYVISILKKKTVTDPTLRIKYALLALLSAVIIPTSHYPLISPEHVEKIKDVDVFLSYPWGRVSFEMLISSIKERNEVSLSQNTIALKGFVLAIQLVMIQAVPSLTGVVEDARDSGSEVSSSEAEDVADDQDDGNKNIKPSRVKLIDTACKVSSKISYLSLRYYHILFAIYSLFGSRFYQVNVESIISAGVVLNNVSDEGDPTDDEEDALVDNLVSSIETGFSFSNSHFIGGATKLDVIRMREEGKKEAHPRKSHKLNRNQKPMDPLTAEDVASIVKNTISGDLLMLGEQIKVLGVDLTNSQNLVCTTVKDMLANFQREMVKMISNVPSASVAPQPKPTEQNASSSRIIPTGTSNPIDIGNIILEAMNLANSENISKNKVICSVSKLQLFVSVYQSA